ncbi:MAG: hypothetical protein M1565_03570 [Actinobacteria bacterium]|nr:hypothetical protein [Actinomycetota bacterium]
MPPGMNQAPEVEFDPTTAPVVPDGQTPEEYVREYLELCSAGEFEQAYTMLPIATQLRYGTAASFIGNSPKRWKATISPDSMYRHSKRVATRSRSSGRSGLKGFLSRTLGPLCGVGTDRGS